MRTQDWGIEFLCGVNNDPASQSPSVPLDQALKSEETQLLSQYHACDLSVGGDLESVMSMRKERERLKAEIEVAHP